MGVELYPTVRAWLTRARNDLANAEFTAGHRSDLFDTVVYHCQQAAEKAMKSYLVSEGLVIPKTHDVGKLVELATAKHAEFSRLQQIADAITPLATEFRYPADDEAPMPTVQQTMRPSPPPVASMILCSPCFRQRPIQCN